MKSLVEEKPVPSVEDLIAQIYVTACGYVTCQESSRTLGIPFSAVVRPARGLLILRGGKKTNMTETSDKSKVQTAENQLNQPNQLIAFDPNNSMQEKEIKGQVEKLLQAGLIKENNSPYSAPVTLAFKRDEGKKTRLCIDFRKLNALCKADSEPLPIMDSLLDKLARAKCFSTLDLASGYWHVPIHPKDTEKLTFCTNFGLYEWCRLSFEIKGSTNIETDMLSRHPVAHHLQHSCHLLDIDEIKTLQKNDNLGEPKYHEIKGAIVIKKKNLHKIVIPFSLRLKLLNQAHEHCGHPAVQKMLNLISLQYYWPNIRTDISEFVKHYMVCQLNKKRKQKKFRLLQQVPPTSKPFGFISVDTVGGFIYYNYYIPYF
ncbi:retrovirus-related Pol polyprotein from transposon 17.6 [Trichonephila clavipes]|nr:retrovirus-related Pol polyprotein from transposon 17.6 [Trichonephila clavipes]